jgi:hypothetical protein
MYRVYSIIFGAIVTHSIEYRTAADKRLDARIRLIYFFKTDSSL